MNELDKIKKALKKIDFTTLEKSVAADLKKFNLHPDAHAGPTALGRAYADSNLGGNGDGRMLRDCEMDGVDPNDEIRAWTRMFKVAQELAIELQVGVTNKNMIYLMHSPKADKAY